MAVRVSLSRFTERIVVLFDEKPFLPVGLCLLLLFPALLINLGAMPLLADEPIRALVALELMDSGNYFVSTLQGVYYYNKPPLYNWLLILSFKLIGNESEWAVRLPTVVFLLSFAGSIFLFVKRYLGRRVGFITAFAFITCGRILLYDSMLGLIDTFFSWVTYLAFMSVFYFYEKGKWSWLFIISYALTAIGFMLKGLPSLAFQGITLLVCCWYTGNFRKLFSGWHLLGLLTLATIIGSYFYVYGQYNSLDIYLKTLWSQSSERTVAEKPWQESVVHFFVFPFDFLQHFVPWTLLVVCCFRRAFIREVMATPFLKFNFLILLATFPIYWFSPATIPRYLFMLMPLFFTLIIDAYFRFRSANSFPNRLVDTVLLVALGLVTFAVLIPPFFPITSGIAGVWWKSGLLFIVMGFLSYLFYRATRWRLVLLILYLLCLRIGFNWFILPARLLTFPEVGYRKAGITVGKLTRNQPLYLYQDTRIDHDEAFYITRERGSILKTAADSIRNSDFYLAEDRHLVGKKHRNYYSFYIDDGIRINLVKFSE